MVGPYAPPDWLMTDCVVRQSGSACMERSMTAAILYKRIAFFSYKGWSSPIFVFSSHFLWRSCERPLWLARSLIEIVTDYKEDGYYDDRKRFLN